MLEGERKAKVTRPFHEAVARIYRIITLNEAWIADCKHVGVMAVTGLKNPCVLDLGTGPATLPIQIANQSEDAYIIGFDLALRMLQEARKLTRDIEQIELVRGDAHSFPFKKDAFDAITGHSFLYLTADPSRVLEEARKTLKIDGKLVLMEPSRRIEWRALWKFKGNINYFMSMIGGGF